MRRPTPRSGLTRRRFVQAASAALGLTAAPAFLRGLRAGAETPSPSLFTLGVASGDPDHHSVVLWTRLAPEPLAGGGLGERRVTVNWEVSTDAGMQQVVQRGSQLAGPESAHALHVVVSGLQPDRWYYYRFAALGEQSRVGRTRTFPAPTAAPARLRFAAVSCQSYPQGFYRAYADLNQQELDFVVHVGDYIYEGGPDPDPIAPDRNHPARKATSLDDYRRRYALYRLDPDLQEAHARFPFVVAWDDHEVSNDYAGASPGAAAPAAADFLARRRNAYQAYGESMPLRSENRLVRPDGSVQHHRSLAYGDLARLVVLDTRQHRSLQPAGDGLGSSDPDSKALEPLFGEPLFDADGIRAPAATLLGAPQERWLGATLSRSRTTWNVLAQQVLMARWNAVGLASVRIQFDPAIAPAQRQPLLARLAQVGDLLRMDGWDGYPAARQRLFELIARSKASNPIVLSGDMHSAWGANLLADFGDANSRMIAAEFVTTSISSDLDGPDPRPMHTLVRAGLQPANPHVAYYNGLYRGYCVCDVDRTRWQTSYRAVGGPAQVMDPSPGALRPRPTLPVDTDAVLEIAAGFGAPDRHERIRTLSARTNPL